MHDASEMEATEIVTSVHIKGGNASVQCTNKGRQTRVSSVQIKGGNRKCLLYKYMGTTESVQCTNKARQPRVSNVQIKGGNRECTRQPGVSSIQVKGGNIECIVYKRRVQNTNIIHNSLTYHLQVINESSVQQSRMSAFRINYCTKFYFKCVYLVQIYRFLSKIYRIHRTHAKLNNANYVVWYDTYHISFLAITTREIFIFTPLNENKSRIYRKKT